MAHNHAAGKLYTATFKFVTQKLFYKSFMNNKL